MSRKRECERGGTGKKEVKRTVKEEGRKKEKKRKKLVVQVQWS